MHSIYLWMLLNTLWWIDVFTVTFCSASVGVLSFRLYLYFCVLSAWAHIWWNYSIYALVPWKIKGRQHYIMVIVHATVGKKLKFTVSITGEMKVRLKTCRLMAEAAAFRFMFKSFSSAGERWHKPAEPTQHMKNETLHCLKIHLRKSLDWDVHFRVEWQRGEKTRGIRTEKHPGGRQRQQDKNVHI